MTSDDLFIYLMGLAMWLAVPGYLVAQVAVPIRLKRGWRIASLVRNMNSR